MRLAAVLLCSALLLSCAGPRDATNGAATYPDGIANSHEVVQTETFAPILYVMKFSTLDEALHQQNAVRRRIGVVFQDPSLDQDLTAWENLDLHGVLYGVPRAERHERAQRLLELFELADRRNAVVKTFSGGMRRRLEIARGLLHTPRVLFLDEPTLGLDPQSRNQMWTHVQNLNQSDGVTVFLTTHYMDEADRVAHRIAIIDHGRIVAIGSSAELKQRTNTQSLEAAYLALTGTDIRDESVGATDRMRQAAQMWRRR